MDYARAFRVLRAARGLTQSACARKCGISQAHVSRIEDGNRTPSMAVVAELSEALDVQPWLVGVLASNEDALSQMDDRMAISTARALLAALTRPAGRSNADVQKTADTETA